MHLICKAYRKTKCKRKTSCFKTELKPVKYWVKFAMVDSLLNTSKFQ